MAQSNEQQHSRVVSALLTVAKASIVIISVVMIVVTLAQVIARYVVASPLPWSEELARYCFVWIVFLGGALGLARGVHLGVDIFVNRLPSRVRRWIELLVTSFIACFAIAVIKAALPVIDLNMFQRSPALGIQMSWIYIAIPTSMTLITAICIERIVKRLRSRKEG